MSTQGIDVSQWQGNINFAQVKAAGLDFVIIRAGYGKTAAQKDPYFEQNYTRAKAAGLNVGVYWYSYAQSTAEAQLEAAACMECIKGKKFEYPIFFDLEESSQFAKGRSFCDSLVTTFCSALEKAGYFAGLYISRAPLQSSISPEVANKYALWVAEYDSRLNYSGSVGMWQNTSSYRVNGISGNVDHDFAYVDYPRLIKQGGYNGYPKAESTVLDTEGFKKGDKGLGVLAYKQLLLLAKKQGFVTGPVNNDAGFGGGTENATNEVLEHFGYVQNGIAGTSLVKKLGETL